MGAVKKFDLGLVSESGVIVMNMSKCRSAQRQKGVILLMSIMAVSVCAILSLWMRSHMNAQIDHIQMKQQIEQIEKLQKSTQQLIRFVLSKDVRDNDYDTGAELWAQWSSQPAMDVSAFIPDVTGGPFMLSGSARDESGKLNLGVMLWSVSADGEAEKIKGILLRLCQILDVNAPSDEVLKNMMNYNNVNPVNPIYRIEQLKELGWGLSDVERLRPYITIAPKGWTKMNINFMEKPLMAALFEDLTLEDVELIDSIRREEKGFKNLFQMNQALLGRVERWNGGYTGMLQTQTHHFEVKMQLKSVQSEQKWDWEYTVYRIGTEIWFN